MNKLTLTILVLVVLLVGFWLGKQHSKMCPSVTVVQTEAPVAGPEVAPVSEAAQAQ
jgi:hypothetical protein